MIVYGCGYKIIYTRKKQEMVKDTKLEELIEEGIDDLKELLENSYLIS
ncbi:MULTISPECIES: hypothetical protein [unclassified Thomasclavelia]|nr:MULTISPECIES: hypothetical protein [unclassified Thomasclavelia]